MEFLRLPVVSAGAEHLVMGMLMRRNILTYKAPMNNEGYDLICIHPDPRHQPRDGELTQVRVQVKSRFASDCDRGFPVKEKSLNAFDYVVVVFLNIGKFGGCNDGTTGEGNVEYFTLPASFVRKHHHVETTWQKVKLRHLSTELVPYAGTLGFDQIAERLGIARPVKLRESRRKGRGKA